MTHPILKEIKNKFITQFGRAPHAVAYAPGRVEILGNHTDYNEGYVLSAAINMGTFFLAAPSDSRACRLLAGDIDEMVTFSVTEHAPTKESSWSNYVKGVFAGLQEFSGQELATGFDGAFLGNIPLGAGLSSSAALEMSSALALASVYGIDQIDSITMAKIGQAAEHHYAGVQCGLLDQISSLFGKENELVISDFRTLNVGNIPLGGNACFLMCNTHAKHALVDGEYNERRAKCEEAAAYFTKSLQHPIRALRDVSWEEWETHRSAMDETAAKRSAHVIGENTRVLKGKEILMNGGSLKEFGKLMFESHHSSIGYFENSCPELDLIVRTAEKAPAALGARLSGGGFGGSAVVLVHPEDAKSVSETISDAYKAEYGQPCDIQIIKPSEGADLIEGR